MAGGGTEGAGGEGVLTEEKLYLESACRIQLALGNEAIAQGYERKRGASRRVDRMYRSTRIRPYQFHSLSWIDSVAGKRESLLAL